MSCRAVSTMSVFQGSDWPFPPCFLLEYRLSLESLRVKPPVISETGSQLLPNLTVSLRESPSSLRDGEGTE